MAKVFSVTSVQLQILKSNPTQILVVAHGMASTSGWKNIDLVPIPNSDGDGVLDLDFVGTPPTGIVLQVLTPVTGDFVIQDADKLTGVMVHARTNDMTAIIGATNPGGPSTGVAQFAPFDPGPGGVNLTTFRVGEEGSNWFGPSEKLPHWPAEKWAFNPAESFPPDFAEKIPPLPAEINITTKPPITDFTFPKDGGFTDPGPMFRTPFGTR